MLNNLHPTCASGYYRFKVIVLGSTYKIDSRRGGTSNTCPALELYACSTADTFTP